MPARGMAGYDDTVLVVSVSAGIAPQIRYRAPLPVGVSVRLEGRCEKRKARLALMQGLVIRTDTRAVVAQASGSFMISAASQESAG